MANSIDSDKDQQLKVRQNRLRRMAERQGKLLEKSRRRDVRARDYGRYRLLEDARDLEHQRATIGFTMTLSDVEARLLEHNNLESDLGID